MIKRSIYNYNKDVEFINNDLFIESCLNLIEKRVDNLSSFDYHEIDPDRKKADALFYLQLSGRFTDLYNNQNFLEKNENHLDWELISCDNRIKWTIELIKKFEKKLSFGTIHNEYLNNIELNFIQRANHICPSVSGVSLSPNLNSTIIEYFENIWDWEILANNPKILELVFDTPYYFSKCIQEISFSANPGWTINDLLNIKEIYKNLVLANPIDLDGFWGVSNFRNIEINWHFSWTRVFKSAPILWNDTNIELFLDILNNQNNRYSEREDFSNQCWQKISNNITDKSLIIRFKDKLSFYSLANNEKIIWDKDLMGLLIKSTFTTENIKMDGYYGNRIKELPYFLEKIKITEEAILFYKDFWNKKYLYGRYHRNSDGLEEKFIESTFLYNLKKNKEIIWENPFSKNAFFDLMETGL